MTEPRKPPNLAERAAERLSAGGDASLSAVAADTLIKAPALAAASSVSTPLRTESAAPAATTAPPAAAGGTEPFPKELGPKAPVAPDPLVIEPASSAAPTALAGAVGKNASVSTGFVDMAALEGAGLVVGGPTRTRISEEYRIAVSRVLRSVRGRRSGPAQADTIMITSARPNEGKSFTALNLAGAIAHNVMRPTVLVDVDGKQKSLSYQLGLSERIGLLDIAASSGLRIEDIVVRTAIDHLSILPIGRNAGIIMDSAARRPISQVIERMARRFPDHIFVLDLPPCLSTSDPSTLAPIVTETIVVVEAEKTQRSELEAALDLIKLCPKITLLLNKLQATNSYTFGAYDYYGSYS